MGLHIWNLSQWIFIEAHTKCFYVASSTYTIDNMGLHKVPLKWEREYCLNVWKAIGNLFNFSKSHLSLFESLNSLLHAHCAQCCQNIFQLHSTQHSKLIFCALALPVASRRHHPHFSLPAPYHSSPTALHCPPPTVALLLRLACLWHVILFVPHLSFFSMLLVLLLAYSSTAVVIIFIVAYLYIFNNLCVCTFSLSLFCSFFGFWFAICRSSFVVVLCPAQGYCCCKTT